MNLRCAFCQTPFTLSRNEMLYALQKMDSENLSHYDAHCPRCRRVTQIPRQRMEMSFPGWRQAVQEAMNAPVAEAPKPAPVMEKSAAKVEQKSAAAKPKEEKKLAANKATTAKAASKPAKKTPATKKPAAKPKKTATKAKKK